MPWLGVDKTHDPSNNLPLLLLPRAGEPSARPQPARQPSADARELSVPHLRLLQLCPHAAAQEVEALLRHVRGRRRRRRGGSRHEEPAQDRARRQRPTAFANGEKVMNTQGG